MRFNILQDTVTIKILGQEYKVRAGGNAEHVRSLSHYIDAKVLEVQQQRSAITTTELVALVMLNMADDVAQTKAELESLRQEVSERIDALLQQIDART